MEANLSAPLYRKDLSEGMSRGHNMDFSFVAQNYSLNREPEYLVYLYNVSEQSFKVSRPPLMREFTIAGRKTGEQYALVTSLPQPLLTPKGNVDSNEIDIVPTDTRRFVTDIINPDNLTIDQDAVIAPDKRTSQGNDLGQKGVFWSLNNPPTDKEVKRAYDRMEGFYTAKLNEAKALETSNPQALRELLGPEHHAAAEYFGIETSWHGKQSRPMDCPNCGDRVKAGVAFHKTDEGVLCIIDWKRAVAAGVRTRAQAFDVTGDEQFAPKEVAKAEPKDEPKVPNSGNSQGPANVPSE